MLREPCACGRPGLEQLPPSRAGARGAAARARRGASGEDAQARQRRPRPHGEHVSILTAHTRLKIASVEVHDRVKDGALVPPRRAVRLFRVVLLISAERARPVRKERRSDSSSARTAGAGATPKCGRARNELVDEPRRQHAMPPSSHHRDASKPGSVPRPAATFSVGRAPAVPRAAASTTTRAKGACELRKQLHGAPTPRRRADAAQRSVASTDSSSDRERAWRDRRWRASSQVQAIS